MHVGKDVSKACCSRCNLGWVAGVSCSFTMHDHGAQLHSSGGAGVVCACGWDTHRDFSTLKHPRSRMCLATAGCDSTCCSSVFCANYWLRSCTDVQFRCIMVFHM